LIPRPTVSGAKRPRRGRWGPGLDPPPRRVRQPLTPAEPGAAGPPPVAGPSGPSLSPCGRATATRRLLSMSSARCATPRPSGPARATRSIMRSTIRMPDRPIYRSTFHRNADAGRADPVGRLRRRCPGQGLGFIVHLLFVSSCSAVPSFAAGGGLGRVELAVIEGLGREIPRVGDPAPPHRPPLDTLRD
jgi:hypothetical protein